MNPWTTACGEDAHALGLRRADGHWDETALKAHVRECPKCNEVFRVNGLPPFRELLGRLLPLVPAIKRRNVELVCTGCLSRGINRTLIESRATATPDRLVEIADAHRRDVHATSDRDAMIEPPGSEK
jgi:hypothetical protein